MVPRERGCWLPAHACCEWRRSEKEEGVSESVISLPEPEGRPPLPTAAGGDAAADTVAAPEEPPAARFGKDDVVIVTYKGHAHPAKVRRVRADTYDVEYDDGEKEKHVAFDVVSAAPPELVAACKAGAPVLASLLLAERIVDEAWQRLRPLE